MRGLKLGSAPASARLPQGRAVCPANEGIETRASLQLRSSFSPYVARSAPLMRGLKLQEIGQIIAVIPTGRAVCPANEGIETCCTGCLAGNGTLVVARSAPLMRGLKPVPNSSQDALVRCQVARSAPLMRGLKQVHLGFRHRCSPCQSRGLPR